MMHDVFALYTEGLHLVLRADVLLWLLTGTVSGVVIGALPGLTAVMGLAVMTPLTFGMSTTSAFAMLMGIYCGGIYGGSITAIVAKIPGSPSSMMTTLDGYPMAQRGEAGKAIGIATVSSCIGGLFSVVMLSLFAPIIATFALTFSAQEYFAIAVFGLCIIAYISQASLVKGLIAGVLGLLIATIGFDEITGILRFTFRQLYLFDGLQMIPLLIGLYGLAEVFILSCKDLKDIQVEQKIDQVLPTRKDMKQILPTIWRGSTIGTIIGAIPAAGGAIAAIIAYGLELRFFPKKAKKFGTGIIEGIAAPESANNAVTGGAMIPMLTLGIPGDAATAILIGALLIHGLQPGPMLFRDNLPIVSSIFILIMFANFFFLFFGLAGAQIITRAINKPMQILIPIIMLFCIVGSFSIRYAVFDIFVLIIFGFLGFLFTKVGLPTAPLVLGFVLGNLVETGFRRGLMLSLGDFTSFFTRPICAVFLSLSVLMLFASPIITFIKKLLKFQLPISQQKQEEE